LFIAHQVRYSEEMLSKQARGQLNPEDIDALKTWLSDVFAAGLHARGWQIGQAGKWSMSTERWSLNQRSLVPSAMPSLVLNSGRMPLNGGRPKYV
jgi:hypothetical protein